MLSHLKRRVAQLTVLMLAAMTLALVPASPAVAAVKVPLANAQYSACPASASIPSAGFTDTTSTDVDCVAYYGITTGTTATTYSPTESVTRWQMALFLTRAAVPAGVTLGAGTDDGTFTDVSGKSAEIITAIYQIKDLGITIGTTATTFSPDDNVTREEMALFINRFLAKATLGPGGANDSLTTDDGLMVTNVGAADTTTNYTDIGTGTTYEGRNAITNLWHMGITDDPSSTSTVYSTTYSPASDMTRAAMATFLTEALAHTNARPKGVSLQSSAWDATGETAVTTQGSQTPTLSASYRDDDFGFAAGTPIDVFYWQNSTAEGNTDFLATGLCNTTYTVAASNSVTECYVDAGDLDTDAYGNTVPTVAAYTAGKTTDYWAWTAADATSYDNDLHAADASKITLVASKDATDFSVTTDISAAATTSAEEDAADATIYPHVVKFGTDVVVSFDATVHTASTNTDAATNHKSLAITVQHERWVTDSGNTLVYADEAKIIDSTSIIWTDASGDASFTITSPTDLSSTVANDEVTDKVTITSSSLDFYDGNVLGTGSYNNWGLNSSTGASTSATGSIHIQWHDDTAVFSKGVLSQSSYYGALATAGVTRTATYTAYDQYGAAFTGGEAVTFTSSSTLPSSAYQSTAAAGSDGWTTTAAHGLAVGDTVYAPTDGLLCLPSTVTLATEAMAVAIVTTSTTFQLTDADGDVVLTDNALCGTGTAGVPFARESFASSARTTGAAGTASVTWSDTEGTSGLDTISADPATATDANAAAIATSTSKYYRTQAETATTALTGTNSCDSGTMTADDWCIQTAAQTATLATLAAGETLGGTAYWDDTNDVIIGVMHYGDAGDETPVTIYMPYWYDSNDQFNYTVSGSTLTATTMATWEAFLRGYHTNGVISYPGTDTGTYGSSGLLGVDYANLSTGISYWVTE